MNISIILAHPAKGSFNHAIADVASKFFRNRGDTVYLHDLYEEHFNPILPADEIPKESVGDPIIQRYCHEISVSDGILIIHPNWWGQPPAILKGWVDRVLRPGIAYEFHETDGGEGVPRGLLKAQWAMVFNTSNTPFEREQEVFGDPLEQLWNNCIFQLCGINRFYRKTYTLVCTSTPELRKGWLVDVHDTIEKVLRETHADQ
jgi:NAD(P)H dehydrogenase (quinone)